MAANITEYVHSCVSDYEKFVGIEGFPAFSVKSKEITLEKSLQTGYDVPAAVFYDIPTGKHFLEIWSQLYLPQMNADYLVFHEFTHIWDAETFSQKDKVKHMSNKGYTEYHAAQIEFMKLLGAKNIMEPFSFSMNQKVETFGGTKTAKDFVDMPISLATDLVNRKDFPVNIEVLSTAIGAIFNYYGRRSICKMYAADFEDNVDTSVIASFLGVDTIMGLDAFMLDWFDARKVSLLDAFYGKMVLVLVQRNKLS